MSGVGVAVVVSAVGVVGLLLAISGWLQPAPPLDDVIRSLRAEAGGGRGRGLPALVRLVRADARLLPSDAELRLAGVTAEQHVVWLAAAAVGGLLSPPLVLGVLQAAGVVGLTWFVPVGAGLVLAVLGPLAVHAATVERAAAVRADLRFQLSAYLEVVTMLLAANTGYEGALDQAARAGGGALFVELRRRMREAGARGASLTDALEHAGRELDLAELEQVAATARLSATEGAPVARTLAAKCATLRAALATEHETEARLRTSRLTAPIVGMALIFMSLVIYPALSVS